MENIVGTICFTVVVLFTMTAYFLVELWTPKRTVYPLNESVLIPPNITLMLDPDTVVVEKGETYRQAINRQIKGK
jgi:hypothetical protein